MQNVRLSIGGRWVEPLDPEETGSAGNSLAVVEVLWERRPLVAVGALAVLGGSAFCFVTGETLPVGLLPVISSSLHTSLSATGLLVTVYALVVVVVSAPLTHLTRHIPRRYLLSGILGFFVVATLAAAAAPGYWWLMAARVVTALSQAVFWSIAPVTAAGFFPPEMRERAVAGVIAGGPLALVLGVPACTWIGQQAGWRLPFVVLSGLGLAGVAAVATLLPTTKPSESHAATGTDPDARRYRMLVATTVLAVAGTFTAYTYVSAFLTKVSGLPAGDVPVVLLLGGLGSLLGAACTALLLSRRPRATAVGSVGLLVVPLLGLYLFGTTGAAAAGLQALEDFGMAGVAISMQTRVLVVAPHSTDIASAWWSASYNAGIASGPVIGGLVLAGLGLRSTPLVGGLLAVLALGVVLSEPLAGKGVLEGGRTT
jgi:predicted MFS family arabinose efflux permease